MSMSSKPALKAFRVQEPAPDLRAGTVKRSWMEATSDRFAYRCLPLNMANVTGWTLHLTAGFDATWNGGPAAADITLTPHDEGTDLSHVAVSHFAGGVLTFHTGYLFRTPEGWATWAMAPPNTPTDGITALSGLIETDWLPFPFTMNWLFTRPGTARFEKGAPFCFITLVEPTRLSEITPQVLSIHDDKALYDEYMAWHQSRTEFNAAIQDRDPEALRESWQKHYMKGRSPSGAETNRPGRAKMRMNEPRAKT
ncbi:MAG: DUF6065 family protein [Pseudomonadota bacterium]